MSVNINADTTNGLVLTSDTSGEIKLQSAGADIATVDSSGITMASGKGLAATGHVLQVVNATYGTGVSTSTSTRADTGLTASITPSSSSNKILIFVNMAGCESNTNAAAYLGFWLMRGVTDLIKFEGQAGWTNTITRNSVGACSTNYLDSPSSSSSVTYKVQFNSPGNVAAASFNASSSVSTITLMEIAG